jgi:hypothetical protein
MTGLLGRPLVRPAYQKFAVDVAPAASTAIGVFAAEAIPRG